jgi:hypothetical protein
VDAARGRRSLRLEPGRRRADRAAPQPGPHAARGRERARRRRPDPEPDQRLHLPAHAGRLLRRAPPALGLGDQAHDRRGERPGQGAVRRRDRQALDNENPEGRFGEFNATDLKPYLDSIEQKVAHLAVVSRTPKHYLLPSGQEPSGDAIKSAESGLVRKIERKQDAFGESWEEVMQLARQFQDPKAETSVDSEVVWADASTESEGVRTDATIKKFGAGLIPKEQALEDLGYSQTQISRILSMEASERLLKQVAMPDPTSGKIVLEPGDQAVEPGPSEVKAQTVRA